MKYSAKNPPLQCMMRQSTCYKNTKPFKRGVFGKAVGSLIHSTGANNPNLWRYVQPDDNDPNRAKLLALIGKNNYGSDWNHMYVGAGVHAFIGKLADGTVSSVQVLPWDYKCWGCGSGSKGSCNEGWIQFEICEDGLADKSYFDAAYKEACELLAYICLIHGFNPGGTVTYPGSKVSVPVILDHSTSNKLGLGYAHGDVMHWFPKYGKSLDTVRKDVAALLSGVQASTGTSTTTTTTKPATGATTASTGTTTKPATGDVVVKVQHADVNIFQAADAGSPVVGHITSGGTYTIVEQKTVNGVTWGLLKSYSKAKNGWINMACTESSTAASSGYTAKVTAESLNIRSKPSMSGSVVSTIRGGGVYTIVSEVSDADGSKWGLLKSYAAAKNGWINLAYVKRV